MSLLALNRANARRSSKAMPVVLGESMKARDDLDLFRDSLSLNWSLLLPQKITFR